MPLTVTVPLGPDKNHFGRVVFEKGDNLTVENGCLIVQDADKRLLAMFSAGNWLQVVKVPA